MRILIVSQYYYPEQFQINEIAPELVRRGHDVTVLTGLPNYPKGEIYPGYKVGEEIIEGVRIIRVKEHPRKRGPIHLFWNYISFANNGSRKARRLSDNYDVVFSYQLSPVSMIKPAMVYAKKNNKPLICYCLDIWPESAKAHTSFKPLYSLISSYSKKMYGACDYISVSSRPFIDYLAKENGVDKSKLSYIPQHSDGTMLKEDLTSENNGIADFMYAGNLGKGQTLDVIIKAAAEIKDKHFRIYMVGDGSQKEALEQLVEKLGLTDKVVFHGNQRRENMSAFYRMADALLITLRGDNAVGNTMPGKLQTYMTTGKPILGAINGAAAEVINESQCGKCVPAGDYKGLAKLMSEYIDNKESFSACGQKAAVYFRNHFTIKKYCDDLEQLLEKAR